MRLLGRIAVTLTFCDVLIWIYREFGRLRTAGPDATVLDACKGTFRHGTQTYLALNLMLILADGFLTDPRLGPVRTIALRLLCTVFGAIVQTCFAGPAVVGSSGVAYGLLAAKHPVQQIISVMLIGGLLAMDHEFLGHVIATYDHTASAITGGTCAVLGALFVARQKR